MTWVNRNTLQSSVRLWRRCLFGVAATLVAIVPVENALALNKDEIRKIAYQTTVMIAQGLEKGDLEKRQEFNPGSGVIVARKGRTYYVLTALHVVRTRDVIYGIRTSDGEVHSVDDVDTHDNIIPLGTELETFPTMIQGYDLAVIKFESNHTYAVIPIGDSSALKPGDKLFVSGYTDPNRTPNQRQHQVSEGILIQILSSPSSDGSYSLLYTNLTQRGMSGGSMLNEDGELVGIHGRGKGQNSCGGSEVGTRNSCGMQIKSLLTQFQVILKN
jgi:S1-C subfamily serine protease